MVLLRIITLLCLAAPVAEAQSAFVHVLRGDTIVIERFTRTPTRLDVSMTMKGGARQVTSSRIAGNGHLGAMTLAAYASGAADALPAVEAQVELTGDTAIASMRSGGAPARIQRIPTRAAAQPMLSNSFAQFEALVMAARRARTATATLTGFFVTGGATVDVVLSGLLTDSVSMQVATVTMWLVSDKAGQVIRAGVPSQALVVTRVNGLAASKIAMGRPAYPTPAGAPYSAEQVTVPTTFGHSLGGTFMMGGNYASATSRDFANDIRAAIAYVQTRADVDSTRIFLVGHSEGGMIAPMVAVDEPALAGIVLMAGPGRTGREILRFQSGFRIEHDTTLTPSQRAAALAGVNAGVDAEITRTPWLTFFAAHDPIATAHKVAVPVVMVQGGDDQHVIAAETPLLEKAFRDGGNQDVTASVFPALNHFFILQPGGDPAGYSTLATNLASAEVLGVVADWIAMRAAHVPSP